MTLTQDPHGRTFASMTPAAVFEEGEKYGRGLRHQALRRFFAQGPVQFTTLSEAASIDPAVVKRSRNRASLLIAKARHRDVMHELRDISRLAGKLKSRAAAQRGWKVPN